MANRIEFEMPKGPMRQVQIPFPVIVTALVVIMAIVGWLMFCAFFRVNIGPKQVGIITNTFGDDSGEKFAYGWGQKGTMIETLPPGNYFFNSITRDIKIVDAIDVPAGKAMVLVAKYGGSPSEGKIMAEEDQVIEDPKKGTIFKPGQKGPRPTVYGPGRYRVNTDAFDFQVFDATVITTTGPVYPTLVQGPAAPPSRGRQAPPPKQAPAKQGPQTPQPPQGPAPSPAPGEPGEPGPRFTQSLGIVTSKVGTAAPPGQIVVEEGQKGIMRQVLGPGMYYLHPRMRDVTIVDATDVPAGYVGVVTQKVGDALPSDQLLATRLDQKGVAAAVLGPGTYYLNPHAAKVDRIDARYQILSMENENGIRFPSTDSFSIEVDLAFEWRYTPGEIPKTFVTLGDADRVINNLLVQQARSIGRLEGSMHTGRDFIEGEPRQSFQDRFASRFAASCKEKGITIPRVAVKRIVPPVQISERMRKAVVAQETLLANVEKEKTARIEGNYQEAKSKVAFVERQVEAETELKVQEIIANAAKEKGIVEAETEKQVAVLELQAATIEAQTTELLGQAGADGDRLLRTARADGLKLLVGAFQKASAYVSYKFAEAFTDDTRLILSERAFLELLEGLGGAGGIGSKKSGAVEAPAASK